MTKIQGFVFMFIVFAGFIALNAGITSVEKKMDQYWAENNSKGKIYVIAEREHKSLDFGTVWVLEYMVDGHYYSPVFLNYRELEDIKKELELGVKYDE